MKKFETGPDYIQSSDKRYLDVAGGLAIAAGTAPLTVATAIETAIEHRTLNPFFLQERVGRWGRTYMNVKFQSLKSGASPEMITGHGHEHASLVGRLIRKAGLDEMPQLLNVIRGDISLVGIRPVPQSHLDEYRSFTDQDLFKRWFECYKLNPGLTGEGQLYSNRFPLHTPDVIQARMKIDIESFETASLANDLLTIARTPIVLLSPSHSPGAEGSSFVPDGQPA